MTPPTAAQKASNTNVAPMPEKDEVRVSWKLASKVFNLEDEMLNFKVPVFLDDHEHVPEIDPAYEFRADYILPVLRAIIENENAWLSGHTGTGKSTLVKQVCARLNYPLIRVNFDSEISRMDLIGRDVLRKDPDGVTVSEFVDGILPQAISSPCMLLCDEVDFIRPDVAYVFQRALEDEGLLISEDGGRVVKPHKWSRIVATGNTQGQGDDHGIYQGARAQSMAFLDRFTAWLQCEYLPIEQEKKLIKTLVPDISQRLLNQLMKYVREHREAFTGLKISQPLSPRGVEALAKGCVFYDKRCDNALLESAKYVLLNKANTTDRAVMVGVLDRVATPKKKATSKTKNKETNKKLKEAEKEAQSLKETKEIPF